MSVSFKNQFRDFLWLIQFWSFRKWRGAPWLILAICVWPHLMVSDFKPQTVLAEILRFVAVWAVVCSISLLLLTLALYSFVSVCSPKGTKISQEQVVALTQDGILVRSPRAEMKITWREVRGLDRTKHYLIVRFHEFAGLLIPRRAFQGEEQWRAFYAYCERESQVA